VKSKNEESVDRFYKDGSVIMDSVFKLKDQLGNERNVKLQFVAQSDKNSSSIILGGEVSRKIPVLEDKNPILNIFLNTSISFYNLSRFSRYLLNEVNILLQHEVTHIVDRTSNQKNGSFVQKKNQKPKAVKKDEISKNKFHTYINSMHEVNAYGQVIASRALDIVRRKILVRNKRNRKIIINVKKLLEEIFEWRMFSRYWTNFNKNRIAKMVKEILNRRLDYRYETFNE
jgi:hypothetical protein